MLSVFWLAPFVLLLIGVAVLPIAAPRFWESHLSKLGVSLVLGLPVIALYADQPDVLRHTLADYLSFIILLGSLFVIAGGVQVAGDLEATPAVNTGFLALGALAASFIGTTGASMLLIRPLLQTNRERRETVHTVVFFIFLVSNIGGCLTPLGDPPLFLGYLQGVPFTWTLRLAPAWLFTTGVLLAVYFVWDTIAHRRESPERLRADHWIIEPIRVRGAENLIWLLGVVVAAALLPALWRDVVMVGLSLWSLRRTPREVRAANQFSFGPILEVAAIFVGIFATMIPALEILRVRGGELGLHAPWHFFWVTGSLSAMLDNAPTYLTFVAVAQSLGLPNEVHGVPHAFLVAISLGAVFMGANTYIGNGPNFMVRAIAEERGIRMPTFGGYLMYSIPVLVPVFVLVTILFL